MGPTAVQLGKLSQGWPSQTGKTAFGGYKINNAVGVAGSPRGVKLNMQIVSTEGSIRVAGDHAIMGRGAMAGYSGRIGPSAACLVVAGAIKDADPIQDGPRH